MQQSFKKIITLFILLFIARESTLAQDRKNSTSVLRHVVTVVFKPEASEMQIAAVDSSFKKLAKMKMVKDFEWGIGINNPNNIAIKHIYVTTFANKEDEATYGSSPQHQAHIKLGADYIEAVNAMDYFANK